MRTLPLLAILWATAAHADDPPLGDALRQAAVGSPVYFVHSDLGLVARSADGKLERTLVAGKLADVQLDAARDLVWFVKDRTLLALNLRGEGKPIPIVTGMPQHVSYRPVFGPVLPADDLSSHAELGVEITGQPALHPAMVQGMDFEWWYAKGKGEAILKARVKQAKRAKLVGRAWLAGQATRPARDAGPGVVSLIQGERLTVPPSLADCEQDPEVCGHALPFGKTGWKLGVTSHTCGDFCCQSCRLLDPAKDLWSVPPDTTTWRPVGTVEGPGGCGDYWRDKDQARLLASICDDDGCKTNVCSLGGPCTAVAGAPLGWLDPGPIFLVPHPSGPP